ncbi:MAG TPA: hypothetical protein VFQ44_18110 [Streptosporangiaceae bacterium]|nr:hypothetical protein [Streptosporangiaceae bacterium]
MTEFPRVAVAASRVCREEKWILAALERSGMPVDHLDTAAMTVAAGGVQPPWAVVLNREIGQVRACYLAQSMESTGLRVVNSAAATAICGDKWRTTGADVADAVAGYIKAVVGQ